MSQTSSELGCRHVVQCAPNIQMSYWEWGDPDGMPLLLLHGLADHGLVWRELARELCDRTHCVAPDLRGHGDSSKPATGYRCQDIVADLNALMAQLGWSAAHVIAHSWSAKVALIWAKQQPDAVRSLTLVDPFFVKQLPKVWQISFPLLYRVLPFLKVMGPFESYEQAEQVAQQLKQYRGWNTFQAEVFQCGMEKKADGQWGSKFVVQARDEVFMDMLLVDGLPDRLDLPCTFIQPEQGLNRSSFQINPFCRHLPQLQFVTVPGNHWPFLVEPQAFNSAIAQVLEKYVF